MSRFPFIVITQGIFSFFLCPMAWAHDEPISATQNSTLSDNLKKEGQAEEVSSKVESENSQNTKSLIKGAVEPVLDPGKYLEETRQTVTSRVLRLADTVDTLFGDKRADDQKNKSTLRLSQRYFLKSSGYGYENPAVTLNLHLPNVQRIEKNIQNWLQSKVERASEATGLASGPSIEEEQPGNAWTFHSESGIVLANPLNYFARLRLRRDFITEKFVHSFYEQIGWSKLYEWEEETALTSDYAITRDLLFRFLNVKSWAISKEILSTAHGPSLVQRLSDNAAISYDMRLFTLETEDVLYGEKLSVGSTYRTRLPVGWIFMDINPEIAWERATSFVTQYNLFFRIEFVFGNLKDR